MELEKINDKAMLLKAGNDDMYKLLSALQNYYMKGAENLKTLHDSDALFNDMFLDFSRLADEAKRLIYQYQLLMGFDTDEL